MKFYRYSKLLIIIVLLFSCKPKTAENLEEMTRRASRPEAVLVKTVRLEPSTFYHELISNGKAFASQKAVVPFRVNGLIKELFIKNGQKVRNGELLAVIEDFDFRARLLRAQDVLEKAKIDLKNDLISFYVTDDTTSMKRK